MTMHYMCTYASKYTALGKSVFCWVMCKQHIHVYTQCMYMYMTIATEQTRTLYTYRKGTMYATTTYM